MLRDAFWYIGCPQSCLISQQMHKKVSTNYVRAESFLRTLMKISIFTANSSSFLLVSQVYILTLEEKIW